MVNRWKKGILTGIIFLIFISQLALASIDSHLHDEKNIYNMQNGKTLYVGGNGPNNYTRIQDAIRAAEDGDTIFVYDDSSPYEEDIYIGKNIRLIGENRDTTIIKLDRGKLVWVENVRWFEIKGFTIKDGATVPDGALTLFSCRNVNIDSCNFLNNFYSCILIDCAANIRISNCSFSWSLGCIDIYCSFYIKISRCNFSYTVAGVITFYSIANIVSECNLSNNACGIWLGNSILSKIHHCTFINNEQHAYFVNSFLNFWNGNYWNRSRILPKPIIGEISFRGKTIPWINFDWHPLMKPYEWWKNSH